MNIIRMIKDYQDGKRTMDGYEFADIARCDKEAINRAYDLIGYGAVDNKADALIDDLYDGDDPIYLTDDGLYTIKIHWETKEPLCWCKVNEIVTDANGKPVDYDAAVLLMDDEIREALHDEIAPCTNQEFFDEYAKRHEQKYGEGFIPYVGGAW